MDQIEGNNIVKDILLEEYRQVMHEISEYQKNGLQLASIFLVFFPIAIGFAIRGESWMFIPLQVIIPIFMLIIANLDNNVMMDSAHAVYVEEKLNKLVNKKDIIGWQKCVNYLGKPDKRHAGFFLASILIILFFGLFYLFIYFQFFQILSTLLHKIIYSIISIVFFAGISIVSLYVRKVSVDRVIKFNEKSNKIIEELEK